MSAPASGPASGPAPDLREAELWFRRHGLSYVVPTVRAQVRSAAAPRRLVASAALLTAVAVGAGIGTGLLGDVADGSAVTVSLLLAGAVWYCLGPLCAGPIVRWAVSRTLRGLRLLVPTASRALPLLLVFVTFLFINAEVWQLSAALPGSTLWLVVLLLLGLAAVFLLVRLPEEVDRVDEDVDEAFLRRATAGTPLAAHVDAAVARGWRPVHVEFTGAARTNLVLVLLLVQFVQVLLLVLAVFGFFLLFGSLAVGEGVQVAWTAQEQVHSFGIAPNVSVELVKVSLFLAAFSGLSFTVNAVTDETYRSQFFAAVTDELERALATRVVYLVLAEPT